MKDLDTPMQLGAVALRDRLASGALSALDLVEACLARIAAREPEIGAWAWIDPDYARDQARRLDAHRVSGRALGPLHGLPVGLKDVIDTARIPTENGCALDAGRVPARDAFVVERLRAAGALILGKTVTTELAFLHPGKTRNPHNPAHTPGGSSSGSAAAVADAMVPLAIGTQTGGSVIRPAAFCGVTGYKPTFGAIPRRGVQMQSHTLDTLGVFATDPLGAALVAEALFGFDETDPATALAPPPRLLDTARGAPPLPPVFAFVKPPGWDRADAETHAAFAELTAALGEQVFEVALPPAFDAAAAQRARINMAEMARYHYRYVRDGLDRLGPETRDALEEGARIPARDYLAALDWPKVLNAGLDEIFTRCDAILCPAAPGPAPEGLGATGDPIFNGLWTLCGTPAVTVPILTAGNGLPMGVQLVGPRGDDARLLRTAHWLYGWAGA
ncbi:amidase [Rhodovulum visakhapatnamense]|uniref:Asp-tRNA(Asn)/Glu-tRNA(Gln) amidotransferase A subunit family amidase n=1 Tax=Rhodovulum visakhapatnamense TaxID=364297 RepID=A0A4R8G6M7_9RHOB|nr:amidase [Rhodovulum visakhapatnamense]TDX31822.1 Asp-tRNA(Asn)/Glu-tRNA(Gln) amidotransferase A subunit family amidase [Rhodovulum visakhapatnamense]